MANIFRRHKQDEDKNNFQYLYSQYKPSDWSQWEYVYPDGLVSTYHAPISGKEYDYGKDLLGNEYYIKYYPSWEDNKSLFEIYDLDEDGMYRDKYGDLNFAEFSPYYNPNYTTLDELLVYPKTGKLVLETYKPFQKDDYYWTGHSALNLVPDYPNYQDSPSGYISMDMSDKGYNLVTNNCANATREVMEKVFNKLMNPWFFTTPGDSRDFLLENGGYKDKDGNVVIKLTEEQMLKAQETMMNLRRLWKSS